MKSIDYVDPKESEEAKDNLIIEKPNIKKVCKFSKKALELVLEAENNGRSNRL